MEEEEIKLTEEEIEALKQKEEEERLRREEEERKKKRAEELNLEVAQSREEFNQIYDRAIGILCKDLSSMDLDMDSSSDDEDLAVRPKKSITSADLHSEVEEAGKEMDKAKTLINGLYEKKGELVGIGGDATNADEAIADAEKKLKELEALLV